MIFMVGRPFQRYVIKLGLTYPLVLLLKKMGIGPLSSSFITIANIIGMVSYNILNGLWWSSKCTEIISMSMSYSTYQTQCIHTDT